MKETIERLEQLNKTIEHGLEKIDEAKRVADPEQQNVDHIGTVVLNCIRMNQPLPSRFLDAAEHFVRMAGFSKWCQKIIVDAINEQKHSNSLLKREDGAK